MAHAQKPEFVFPRNGLVHLNRWGRQFSRLLAAEVCASAWVMLDRRRSEVAWEYWLPTPFASFPFTSPPVRHRVPPGSERALLTLQSPVVMSYTTSLTLINSTFCPHSVFMCFVRISKQTAVISLYAIHWLIFITQTQRVYCAVRTEYKYITQPNLRLQMTLPARRPCGHNESCQTGTFRLPWLRFFRDLPQLQGKMPGYNSQRQGRARTLPKLGG